MSIDPCPQRGTIHDPHQLTVSVAGQDFDYRCFGLAGPDLGDGWAARVARLEHELAAARREIAELRVLIQP